MQTSTLHTTPAARRRAGQTLLEIAITLPILTGLLAVTFSAVDSGGDAVASGERAAHVQETAMRCLDDVVSPMPEARVMDLGYHGDWIHFQIPSYDGNPAFDFDRNQDIVWGSQADADGGTASIRFVVDSELGETADNIDYNRDGDKLDRFHLGHLERGDAELPHTPFSGSSILLDATSHAGDVDGDGIGDPIFELVHETRQLLVTLCVMKTDADGRPHLLVLRSSATLRNQ